MPLQSRLPSWSTFSVTRIVTDVAVSVTDLFGTPLHELSMMSSWIAVALEPVKVQLSWTAPLSSSRGTGTGTGAGGAPRPWKRAPAGPLHEQRR
jgi:hypothetical protein